MDYIAKCFFSTNKNASQIHKQTFLVQGVFFKKRHFQWAFDENMSVIHVFIKQIFRAAEKAPLSPAPPHSAV
jgi:two-component SAPR family response regulator